MTRPETARGSARTGHRPATHHRRAALRPRLPALAAVLLALTLVASHALARDVQDVLSDLEASAAGIVDVSFVLEGVLCQPFLVSMVVIQSEAKPGR